MKINLFKFSFILIFIWFFLSVGQAKADESVNVHLEIETATSTIFNDFISVSACPESPGSATTTVNGFCAFTAAGINVEANWGSYGAYITSIGGASEDIDAGVYWFWFSNLTLDGTGINRHPLAEDEHLLFILGINPLKISASNSSPFDGATTTISALQFDQGVFDWIPASDATIDFDWSATTTDANGQADITATSSAPFSVSADKTNFLTSNSINITPQEAHANITIRDGATVAFSGLVALPASNSASVDITPTSASSTVAVPARSLLSVLETLDVAQSEFAITDLQYYSSFNSFIINCMTVIGEADPLCYSWQYNLNGVNPSVGVDQALLKNGDVVFLYFGNQRQVSLFASAATTGTAFTATAQTYDPANNAYVATTGFIIGVTQPDPDNPWSPIEIATSTADANGQAVFTLNTAGTYNVGIQEDYYFPLTTLTITDSVSSSGGSIIVPASSGGGSTAVVSTPTVDLGKAIDFLISKQAADGSFSSLLQTDWAAIALASANANGAAAQKTKSYLLSDPNPLAGLNPVSDYARRAMALMSLNINPYTGTKTNYVKKIIGLYDGQQFGDASLYNDDIFALMVLAKAGYTANDEIIQNAVNFIISKQQADGSWIGPDLTAAAIQALKPLSSMDGVTSVLQKARNFLFNAHGADGGFGNTYATAWVMQAIAALGEEPSAWKNNNNTPENYLALSQGADGGLEKDNVYEVNRLWATSYAIPAVQSKAWFSIMQNFSKQEMMVSPDAANSVDVNDNKIATSTLDNLDIATSSLESFIAASSTEALIEVKVEDEQIEPATVENTSILVKPVKQLAPKVLGVKISSTEPRSIENKQVEEIINQEVEQKKTSTITVSNAIQAAKNNNDMIKATAKEKINAIAKKVLYVAGAGAVLAGIILGLKLLLLLL
ncbi:MAG: prenyltransferase/squalene oxidase repeat-containing protein [Candidatus Falkowbacteria bacterium]